MEARPNSRYAALETIKTGGYLDAAWNLGGDDKATSVRSGQAANAEMWKWILSAAGAGALGRGGLGLARMMRPESGFRPSPSSQDVAVMLPEDEEREKMAAGPAEAVYEKLKGATSGLPWGKNWFMGKGSTTPYTVPALWAAGMPAAMVAGYGGWSGVDSLLDSRRKSEQQGALETAKAEYEQLLRETMAKRGSDDASIERELDELVDMVMSTEKTAALTDARNAGLGMMLSYAVLSALASGKLSYDYFLKRNQRSIGELALRRRSKERFGGVAPIQLKPAASEVA